ncbi:MAG: hypothetical protein EBZ49_00055 [Proteobacteria bacterium]|nr:hypothetical protein [Pseudomonadota bacterium]
MNPTPEQWGTVVVNLTKGELGILAAVGIAVQFLMLLLKGPLGEKAGKWRLMAVSGLTMVGCVLALRTQGMDWASILAHSSTLAASQVFIHQIFKQSSEQPVNEVAEPKRRKRK